MTKRILLMMSGGVDSSVSAALLQEEGYEVVGLTLEQYSLDTARLKDDAGNPCTDILDAKKVADRLGIEHHVLNTKQRFQETVIQHFVDSYKRGLTPNPCTHCNSFVKFEEAYEFSQRFNCDYFATGHYARLIQEEDGSWGLYRAVYKEKDQSYFLYGIRREIIPLIRFPLGEKRKEEVRALAKDMGFSVAAKPGSQDICFAKDVDRYTDFLAKYIPPKEGPIVDREGNRLGTHTGVVNYTVGQRKGLGLTGGPYYVCRIDAPNNAVIVGRKEDLAQLTVQAHEPRWLAPPAEGDKITAQIRSRNAPAEAGITKIGEDRFQVEFDAPQYGVAPGQALVVSKGDKILGGGVILPLNG